MQTEALPINDGHHLALTRPGATTTAMIIAAAKAYHLRDFAIIPVPFRSKNPGFNDWEKFRLKDADLEHHFGGQVRNIGVLLGEPSGWLVDVDLDHPVCLELADQYLPHTPAIFGRPGNRRSHWVYRVTAPVATKKHRSKKAGMLVELRSTGMQTVFPPSTHVSGELIAWETPDAEPALIDPEQLLAAVEKLAFTVRKQIGESNGVATRKSKTGKPKTEIDGAIGKIGPELRACIDSMLRMKMQDHKDGSSRLFAAACRVVEHKLSDREGITAIRAFAQKQPFPQDFTDDQILRRIRDAEKKVAEEQASRPSPSGDQTTIIVDTDEHRVVDQAVVGLAADDQLFQRGGMLVRILREWQPMDGIDRPQGSLRISQLPIACLRERLTRYMTFVKFVKGELKPIHPPSWMVSAIDARGDWPKIRYLTGISDVPILRADGTLWQTPGYDPQSGVLYEPTSEFPPIREDATIDDARAAVAALLDVVCDFRFESDDHRAAWLAALLTPLARFAFGGPTPLFLIDANVRGAGKGLLVQVIGEIVLGHEMPVSSYSHDSEEMRKKITSIAIGGDRVVHLDNLEGSFGNDTLDRALTTTRWKDRILGKSEQVDLPLLSVWYGTGNNVAVGADTIRRVIHIRLDVLEEQPEGRSDFKHPNLLAWVRSERPRLLAHALTILVAYHRAGRPSNQLTPFGSYEGWSQLVRETIVWCGLPDPCRTRVRLAETSDSAGEVLGQFMQAWGQYDRLNNGIVISDLLKTLYGEQQSADEASGSMRVAMENLVGTPPGRVPTPRQVSNKIKHFRRRVISNQYLDFNPNEHNRNGAVWRLHDVSTAAEMQVCESATLIPAPPREIERGPVDDEF